MTNLTPQPEPRMTAEEIASKIIFQNVSSDEDGDGCQFDTVDESGLLEAITKAINEARDSALEEAYWLIANLDPADIDTDWIIFRELAAKKIKALKLSGRTK